MMKLEYTDFEFYEAINDMCVHFSDFIFELINEKDKDFEMDEVMGFITYTTKLQREAFNRMMNDMEREQRAIRRKYKKERRTDNDILAWLF